MSVTHNDDSSVTLQFLMWKFSTSEDRPRPRSTTRLAAPSSYSASSQGYRIHRPTSPGGTASARSTTIPVEVALGRSIPTPILYIYTCAYLYALILCPSASIPT